MEKGLIVPWGKLYGHHMKKKGQHGSTDRKNIEWLGVQLSITRLEDWYKVSMKQIRQWLPVDSFKDFTGMLERVHTGHQWDHKLFRQTQAGRKPRVWASQQQLVHAVQQLFPTHSMYSIGFFN